MDPGSDFLTRIVDDRRRRLDAMKLRVPAYQLRDRLAPTRPAGRLERALRRNGPEGAIHLICEVKRASPSRGILRQEMDPVSIARMYEEGGASAVSLVTEPDHFLGELDWVNRVREAVQLPLLLKDFVIDSYQIVDAAVRGADAVLLLAALLSDVVLQRFITEARLLGLDCLVEVHDGDELRRSLRAGATLVGINHRNLRTFEVDWDVSTQLMPMIPPLVTAVAESGITTAADVTRLRSTRCDAVLIGEIFMVSPDPPAILNSLRTAAQGTR